MTPDSGINQIADLHQKLRNLPAPEPALGVEAYHAERELALANSPACRENYEKYLQASRQSKVDYMPIKLDIENVSRCNFKCSMCVVRDWHKGRRADDLSLESFKKILDEQVGLMEIKLQGIGEPTMQRDDFFEMIRIARARNIWVRTTTNASLLHLNDNITKFVESGVNEVQISIDGADKETFEKIRAGSVFEQVVENCKAFNAACQKADRSVTKMWTVVQSDNVGQLEQLVETAAELGFSNQVFSLSLSDWGLDEWQDRSAELSVEDSLDIPRLEALINLGENLGVKVRFWSVNDKYDTDSVDNLCPWPFERAYVASDERIVPCCYIGNPDVYQIDKQLGEDVSFADVWFGDTYAKFRQDHLDGRIPDACAGCYKTQNK